MERVDKILVVLPNPMGDAILAIPSLRRLREALPGAHITYLANTVVNQVLAGNPWHDEWLISDNPDSERSIIGKIRQGDYGAAILMPNSFRVAWRVWRAGVKRRIGYLRDGRGLFLSDLIDVPRAAGHIVPVAMGIYYGFLIERAISVLAPGGSTEKTRKKDGIDERLELFTSEADRREIDACLARWGWTKEEKFVVLVPGGAFGSSKWWPAEYFARLAERLGADGYRIYLSCAPDPTEQEIGQKIQSAAREAVYGPGSESVSLGGLKELIRRASCLVGNDTGPCHIAAAFGVPLVTLFGATDPRWTVTGYEREIRLRVDRECAPCQQKICTSTNHCLRDITVDEVYQAVRSIMDIGQAEPPCSERQGDLHRPAGGTYFTPYEESFIISADGKGLIHKDWAALLEKHKLANLADVFDYQEGKAMTKPGLGRRERFRLDLQKENGQAAVIYLKRYGQPGMAELLKRWWQFRWAPAGEYDFAAALLLAQKQIPVARPVAFGGERTLSGEKRSFVMLEELPHGEALERLLPRWQEEKHAWALLNNKEELIRHIAKLLRRLHVSGFCHRDLYLSHIFLCRDEKGCERLCLIDLQRVFQPRWRRRRWRVKDVAQFYYSAREYFTDEDFRLFFRVYFESELLNDRQKRFIRSVRRKANRIARHDKKRSNRSFANIKNNFQS